MAKSRKAWSYSGLKEFENCPRKFYECKVAKNYPFVETEQIRFGKVVHTACEEYIRDGKELPQGLEKYKEKLDALNRMEGEKKCEERMALDVELEPVEYFAHGVWVRGQADLLVLNGERVGIIDYKTGKDTRPDKDQLELMAMMVFRHYPEVERAKAGLLFLEYNTFITEKYERKNEEEMWERWNKRVEVLDAAHEADNWAEKPSGLCGWCPVTECKYHKNR